MDKSSIAKVHWRGKSAFAQQLGHELRRLRLARGLRQSQVAGPFSAAFVSAVETGAIVPSLPSLVILLDNLGVSLSAFFAAIESGGRLGAA